MKQPGENVKWVVCPHCHKINPAEKEYCQYCWSPKVQSVQPMTITEAEETAKQWQIKSKRRRIKKWLTIGLSLLAVAIAFTVFILFTRTDVLFKPDFSLNSNSQPGDWAMFRQNQQRTGTVTMNEKAPDGTILWVFKAEAAIHSSPALVDGTIYFGSQDCKLYAVDAATGSKKWEFKTGSWVESSPSVVNGVVYFGSNDGSLYALNVNDGTKLWSFKTKYAIKSSPAISGGVVYFGADDGFFYAINADNGKQIWRYKTRSLVQGSPVVADGIVYIVAGRSLYTLDAYTGRFRMHFETYYPSDCSAVVDGTTVYFGNSSGMLYVVDGKARTWPWEFDIRKWWINFWLMGLLPEPSPQSGTLWGLNLGNAVHSSPAIANDVLYIGVDRSMIAVDTHSCKILWSFETGDYVMSSPVVTGDRVIFGSEDGYIYALNTSGQEMWKVETYGGVSSSPALGNGILYIGSDDGNLYAVK